MLSSPYILYNIGSQTPATIDLGGAIIYLDRGYAKENLKKFITNANGHHFGSQPRVPSIEAFPWTYGHPEKAHNVLTDAGASFTKEAHQRGATAKDIIQYGICSSPAIILPHNATSAASSDPFPLSNPPISNKHDSGIQW
jgi:hypothetical protein